MTRVGGSAARPTGSTAGQRRKGHRLDNNIIAPFRPPALLPTLQAPPKGGRVKAYTLDDAQSRAHPNVLPPPAYAAPTYSYGSRNLPNEHRPLHYAPKVPAGFFHKLFPPAMDSTSANSSPSRSASPLRHDDDKQRANATVYRSSSSVSMRSSSPRDTAQRQIRGRSPEPRGESASSAIKNEDIRERKGEKIVNRNASTYWMTVAVPTPPGSRSKRNTIGKYRCKHERCDYFHESPHNIKNHVYEHMGVEHQGFTPEDICLHCGQDVTAKVVKTTLKDYKQRCYVQRYRHKSSLCPKLPKLKE